MFKLILCCITLLSMHTILLSQEEEWKPQITEREMKIEPRTWETAYQYGQRKVNAMKRKYKNRRIVGSFWLSDYWAHHYYGALEYRNYHWIPQ